MNNTMILQKKNIKLVIVDDDPFFSATLSKCLRDKDLSKIELLDSAIPLLNRDNLNTDLIFMDFKMSDLNGARAAKSIKRKIPKTVIVLMSSSKRLNKVRRREFMIDGIAEKELGVQHVAVEGLRIFRLVRLKRIFFQFLIWFVVIALLSAVLYQFL